MALTEEQRNPWRAIVAGGDYNLTSQDWEDLLTELDSLYTEAPIAPPASDYDLSAVITLTHNKTESIIERGYKITGFVLTDDAGRKCISDMSAVRWFDDPKKFFRMMHPDSDQTASEQKPVAYYDGNKFYANEESASMCLADMDALRPVYFAPQPDYKAQRDALLELLESAIEFGYIPKLPEPCLLTKALTVIAGAKGDKCKTCNGECGWEAAASSTSYFWKDCPDCTAIASVKGGA